MISVCFPNLNNARFLDERIATLRQQTWTDYEVVLFDNFSDDGAYEILSRYAAADARVRLRQAPREGMYANWNNCLRDATREWVYIATSDDTMKPECLATLLAAARQNPAADVVTSRPWMIDEHGRDQDWPREQFERRLAGRRVDAGFLEPRAEARFGWLLCTPTLSITQMLIRRTVFDRVGLFRTEFGSCGDLDWQMRALARGRFYYLPQRLGSWRRHASQATPAAAAPLFRQRARTVVDLARRGNWVASPGCQVAAGTSLGWSDEEIPADLPVSVRRAASWARRCGRLAHPYAALLATRLLDQVGGAH